MDFFGSVSSVEELKGEYHKFLSKWKGTDIMADVRSQYEALLEKFGKEIDAEIAEQESKGEVVTLQRVDVKNDKFADTLEKIINFNMKIEIIGQWIWCFESYEYKEQLKALDFWFSKSKKAWVYSGSKKKLIKTRNKLADIRKKYGSEIIRDKE